VPGKLGPQVGQRDVGLALQRAQDQSGMRLDPSRTSIAALLLGRGMPTILESARQRIALDALTPKRAAA